MNKKEVLKYIQENEFDIQNANASLFAAELVFQSYVNSKSVHGVDFKPVLSHFSLKRENFFYFYQIINLATLKEIGKKIYKDYLRNPKSLEKRIKAHKFLEKELDKIWLEYVRKKDLKVFFKKLINTSKKWWEYSASGEDKGEVINNELAPNFTKRHNMNLAKAREILSILAHPEKPTVLNSERSCFLDVCLSLIDKNEKIQEQIKKYIKTNFWIETDFYSKKDITAESIFKKAEKEIKKIGKEGIEKEIIEIENNFKKLYVQKEEIKKQIKLSRVDKKDIFFAQSIIEWIDERKLGMMKDCYYLFSALEDISFKYNVKYSDFSCYTIDEMFALLEKGKKVNRTEIAKRQKDIFLVNEKGAGIKKFYGQDAQDLLKESLKKTHSEEIKGAVASTGNQQKISGIANIILDPVKEKFIDGTILVTSMTRVEFVPLMRRAKAIITNEGGVACHAAIVSRELGIPCIIGTKIATKNLKNGDKVEMDLNTGIVKIL